MVFALLWRSTPSPIAEATSDGRWGLVVNPAADRVHIFDSATNTLIHDIAIKGKPYQISLSRAFAYVRALESERVSMINLSELNKGATPPVVTFAAGQQAPAKVAQLSIADGIVEAAGEAAVLVASPADATVYYYMEGMNAPMGNFRNYGHRPVAVNVADRTLKEAGSGRYRTKVRIPEAGTYDVAMLLDSPRILHCFQFTAEPNPRLQPKTGELQISYQISNKRAEAGTVFPLRFRLSDSLSGETYRDLQDVQVLYYRAPSYDRTEVMARQVEEGIYQADLMLPQNGAYYVYVAVPSLGTEYADLNYLTLRAAGQRIARDADREKTIRPSNH